jgi:predicted nucleic acid-binding protein
MVLVDTSVLIEFFRGRKNPKTSLFDEILARDIPFGISPYTYQEVLQGARNEQEYERLREYLGTQTMYFLPGDKATHEKAARLYFDLRRSGITVRGTVDILIALTAMENNLMLLHNDRDFDAVAAVMPDCAILNTLP